jgi:multiple sugar transport system permease protein
VTGARGREWWALLPAALLVTAVLFLPVVRVVQLAFSHTPIGTGPVSWAGFEHFTRLWADDRWWIDLRNTLVFTVSSVTLELLLGTAFALLLHRSFRGRGLLRAIAMVPWALPTAIMALAWSWIFNDAFGVANDLLGRLHLIGAPVAWLGSPATAMAAMVAADVWKTTPFVMLVVLAGLQGIPHEVHEAATLDGLGPIRRFVRVTLPMVAPALVVAAVFRTLQAFGAFDLVYVMTGGGPGGSTETVSLYAYRSYFRYLDFGYGSAIALQAVSFAALAGWVVLRATRPREARA